MKIVTKLSDIPTGKHYVILRFSSIYIPGDERSRTNPGHGYPAFTEPVTNYYLYTNEAEWKAEITRLESNYTKESYTALISEKVNVKTTVSVSIN